LHWSVLGKMFELEFFSVCVCGGGGGEVKYFIP
jgi:hypothetical protein